MFLDSLMLKQFRNYDDRTLGFKPGLNLICGPNASGKSNILEAVYLLAKSRSTRTSNIKEAVMWGKNGFYVRGIFESCGGSKEITLRLDDETGKTFKINGREISRISDFIGEVPVVLFVPDDLRLIKGEPELRRKYINSIIMQADTTYLSDMVNYGKALAERNQALRQMKNGELDKAGVDVWTQELVVSGSAVIRARHKFAAELNRLVAEIKSLFGACGQELEIRYRTIAADTAGGLEERFRELLEKRRGEEAVFCQTLTGPHRDDLEIYSHGRALKNFGSQGQQRKAVLTLKIASVLYLKRLFNEWPVTLFDDVLSELDEENQHAFEDLLIALSEEGPGWQCFITTAERLGRWNGKNIHLIDVRDEKEKVS